MKKTCKKITLIILLISSLTHAQYSFEHTDIWAGARASSPKHFVEYNDELYFQASNQFQNEIWKTDGTIGNVTQVADLNGNLGSTPESFKVLGNNLIFVAYDATTGTELYKYDGTNTILLKDIRTGSAGGMTGNYNEDYEIFTELNNELLFMAQTQNGRELWKTDGTINGTVLVKNFSETTGGVSHNNYLRYMYKGSQKRFLGVILNNELFFTVTLVNSSGSPIGVALWKTDGTEAGTTLVNDTLAGIDQMIVFNSNLLFAGSTTNEGVELWKSDGTNIGTVIVADNFPNNLAAFGKSSSPTELTVFNNEVFYRAYGYDAAANIITDYKLYKTDATTITLVKDINPGHLSTGVLSNFKIYNNELYFPAKSDSAIPYSLWKTDGTEAGTIEVFAGSDVGISSDLFFRNTTIYNNEIFFNHQNQLWKTDGTITGTIKLSDDGTTNTPFTVSLFKPKVFNNKLWMRAYIPGESSELWNLSNDTANINNTDVNKFSVYPNPANNTINVSINNDKILERIRIYNELGVKIKEINLNNSSKQHIDISTLSKGVYFINIKSKNETVNQKFIKL